MKYYVENKSSKITWKKLYDCIYILKKIDKILTGF